MKNILKISLWLIIWQFISSSLIHLTSGWQYILPPPSRIITTTFFYITTIIPDLITTLIVTIISLIISVVISYLISYLIIQWRLNYILTIISWLQIIPPIMLIPILVSIFNFGIINVIIINVILSSFPLIRLLVNNLDRTKTQYRNLITSLHLARWEQFKLIYLPSSISTLHQGLLIILTYSIANTLTSEYLIGQSGLGLIFKSSINNLNISLSYGIIIIVITITLSMIKLFNKLYQRSRYAQN